MPDTAFIVTLTSVGGGGGEGWGECPKSATHVVLATI